SLPWTSASERGASTTMRTRLGTKWRSVSVGPSITFGCARPSVTVRLLRAAQHLSTLALERKAGLLTAEDGVRRLRLLDAKGKIWTQDMLLRVRRHDVSLLDADTELEVFPLSSVQQCQAVMNACGFDSILALVCKDSGQSKADLHLFQCDHVKAHLIRADIQSAVTDAKGGGPKKRPDVLK
uniref:PID domain-containing protein n=1 Tax=Hippocampus comes TaxID=109280 RepID=A0A3Q2XKM1_HIPCM